MKNKLIIVAGCSGSGKTTVTNRILKQFKKGQGQVICLDRFYWGDKKKIPFIKEINQYNYDHPSSFDWKLVEKTIKDLLNNKPVRIPKYDYVHSRREKNFEKRRPTKIIILEGMLSLYNDDINKLASLKVFLQVSLDTCFIRRLLRDQKDRGRTVDSIVKQWQSTVKPMYEQFVRPTETKSNIILPWDGKTQDELETVLELNKKMVKKHDK